MYDEDGKYLAETLRVLSVADECAARTAADADRLRPAPGRRQVRGLPSGFSHGRVYGRGEYRPMCRLITWMSRAERG